MINTQAGFALPANLDEIDLVFMTQVLRASGAISATNEVITQEESGVGMTAGYFSAIKKVRCTYREPTAAPASFVVKAWPSLELLPREAIASMFRKDIKAYALPANQFYPRVKVHLASFDQATDRYVLVMEDATTFAEHKVHERELGFDDVMRLIPRMVDVAVAWEGCDQGKKDAVLTGMEVDHWTSDANLGSYKQIMPHGARLFDKLFSLEGSSIIDGPAWGRYLGGPDISELLTRKLDAFFADARVDRGATCTLSHGDLRGDNLFFTDGNPTYPDGWLAIDFQLMFRGPVPSDLAYLMGSASVLPEVYMGDNLWTLLRAFHERFLAKTSLYRDYPFDKFVREYAMMTTVLYMYFIRNGSVIAHAGAYGNELGMRVELGGKGATEADLSPEERRQRMWWRKTFKNFRENFKTFNQYDLLGSMPDGTDPLGPWTDLPDHLR